MSRRKVEFTQAQKEAIVREFMSMSKTPLSNTVILYNIKERLKMSMHLNAFLKKFKELYPEFKGLKDTYEGRLINKGRQPNTVTIDNKTVLFNSTNDIKEEQVEEVKRKRLKKLDPLESTIVRMIQVEKEKLSDEIKSQFKTKLINFVNTL
jgi:hypothetical protein